MLHVLRHIFLPLSVSHPLLCALSVALVSQWVRAARSSLCFWHVSSFNCLFEVCRQRVIRPFINQTMPLLH